MWNDRVCHHCPLKLEVFSRSRQKWFDGQMTKCERGRYVGVEYEVGLCKRRKTLHVNSDELRPVQWLQNISRIHKLTFNFLACDMIPCSFLCPWELYYRLSGEWHRVHWVSRKHPDSLHCGFYIHFGVACPESTAYLSLLDQSNASGALKLVYQYVTSTKISTEFDVAVREPSVHHSVPCGLASTDSQMRPHYGEGLITLDITWIKNKLAGVNKTPASYVENAVVQCYSTPVLHDGEEIMNSHMHLPKPGEATTCSEDRKAEPRKAFSNKKQRRNSRSDSESLEYTPRRKFSRIEDVVIPIINKKRLTNKVPISTLKFNESYLISGSE